MDTSDVIFSDETNEILGVLKRSKTFSEILNSGARYNLVWNFIQHTLYFLNKAFRV